MIREREAIAYRVFAELEGAAAIRAWVAGDTVGFNRARSKAHAVRAKAIRDDEPHLALTVDDLSGRWRALQDSILRDYRQHP